MFLTLIPFPYRVLALLALATALIGFGYVKGLCHQQALDARAALGQVEAARRVEAHEAAITNEADAVHFQHVEAARVVYQTVTKEVIRYAQDPGAVVRLDAGWVRDHDDAALGVVSDPAGTAGRSDAGSTSVTAADALETVTDNYASCNATRQQLIDLQNWVRAEMRASP